MGWLATLRQLSKPTTDPAIRKSCATRAWAMRTLNTQLASWTQLRHDTILYAKQSYTSGVLCYYPAGFVEPVPHFWARLQKMVERAADLLARTPHPASADVKGPLAVPGNFGLQVAFLRNFAAKVAMLKSIAGKQLEQKDAEYG